MYVLTLFAMQITSENCHMLQCLFRLHRSTRDGATNYLNLIHTKHSEAFVTQEVDMKMVVQARLCVECYVIAIAS